MSRKSIQIFPQKKFISPSLQDAYIQLVDMSLNSELLKIMSQNLL